MEKFSVDDYYLPIISIKNIIEDYYWLIKLFSIIEYN